MIDKSKINWPAVESFIDEYANSYELIGEDDEGREGSYNPTEGEIYMISDAIRGLLDDDEFLALLSASPTQPVQPSDTPRFPHGCARSHPHEDMNAECEALTVKARAENKAAQHQKLPSDAEILHWIFAQTKTDNGKTARENIAAAMKADREGS